MSKYIYCLSEKRPGSRITETHRTKRSLYTQIIAATNLTDLSVITWPAQKRN